MCVEIWNNLIRFKKVDIVYVGWGVYVGSLIEEVGLMNGVYFFSFLNVFNNFNGICVFIEVSM